MRHTAPVLVQGNMGFLTETNRLGSETDTCATAAVICLLHQTLMTLEEDLCFEFFFEESHKARDYVVVTSSRRRVGYRVVEDQARAFRIEDQKNVMKIAKNWEEDNLAQRIACLFNTLPRFETLHGATLQNAVR